jgi:predicted transcriptional regulator
MNNENMMLTLDSEKKAALSAIATLMKRDLSDIVNEAISTYLEMNQCLLAEITKIDNFSDRVAKFISSHAILDVAYCKPEYA